MKRFSLKNISITLLIVVIVLLFINVIVSKLTAKDEQLQNKEEISGVLIDSLFRSALYNYGIEDNWIKKKTLRQISGDSLFASYSIVVPKDVPINLLQLEAKKMLWDYDADIISEEVTKEKKVLLKISSDNFLKLAAELSYGNNIRREYGAVSFLVKDIKPDDIEKYSELLGTPELFYAVLVPDSKSKAILNDLKKFERRFAVILNDDITEFDYKLSSSISENRTLLSLKNIISSFYSAAFFIVDVKSDLYESANYKVIEAALKKRNIKIVKSSRFDLLKINSLSPESSFSEFIKTLGKSEEKAAMISAEDYLLISELIPAYRKIGYRFIQPGELVLNK
ncbi:MAG: hypothetical protein RBR74_08225 [Ignavibacteriaceae bacterium]|jgi:hypothetical protein|nr:hypothetical protein [Ignavibacteriaceae bacterium]